MTAHRTIAAAAVWLLATPTGWTEENRMHYRIDPMTRQIHVTYRVPKKAPDEVRVRCSWSPAGGDAWRPARVEPLLSPTAWELAREENWAPWARGELVERRAAGQERTLVFNPYPEAQSNGRVDIDFRVRIPGTDGEAPAEFTVPIQADNSDVIVIDDWRQVLQKEAVATESKAGRWHIQTPATSPDKAAAGGGNRLYGPGGSDLPQLTYPLDLKGTYALFVCSLGVVRLRLSGDERYDRLGFRVPGHERLWKWSRMDWQHLVIRQNYNFTGPGTTRLNYIRLVPLSAAQVEELEARLGRESDRMVAAYWEPYSYAFSDNVQDAYWHREYLGAYREANVSIVDTQLGRFGCKSVFETRVADQLLYQTRGDPIGAIKHPTTTNVGRMQQYTNTLQASLKYGKELGLTVHANFGATNCYPGSPLQNDFSKAHPEWMRGSALRYEVPEVRQYILSIYREALEIGAPGISVDFCRYPEGIDSKETCNIFFRELRALADEFGAKRGVPIPILTRFPAHGVRRSRFFDYPTWISEGLVDYLCPSSIQGRFHYFDVTPYQEATRGTRCTLLPQLDALSWGLAPPGLFLWRVQRLYDRGIPGIYIYQADALVVNDPVKRRWVRMLRSRAAVNAFWERDAELRPRASKGIYLTRFNRLPGYHYWERINLWVEGVPMGPMEIYLDGKRINRYEGPPYMVGSQDQKGDKALPEGEHELRVRIRDGDGWLEQTFHIVSGG